MSGTTAPADDFTELVDPDFPRVDLVGKSANGRRALIAKADATTATIDDHPDSDFAYIEPGGKKDENGRTTPRSLRHFPIYDAAHVRNALARAPQSEFGSKAMPKIEAAAKKFGVDTTAKSSEEDTMTATATADVAKADLPAADSTADSTAAGDGSGNIAGEGQQTEATVADRDAAEDTAVTHINPDGDTVAKADGETAVLDDKPGAVDLTEPLVVPSTNDPSAGDGSVPGSPAWEAVDAASARKWTQVLMRVKNGLTVLGERESIEAATGDADAMGNAFDLDDATCAIDYAVSVLAPYAVSEENEAIAGTEELDLVAKAARAIDDETLDVVEQYGPVVKAGRVLSAANEAKIRGAVDSLSQVLSSLPAPSDDVAKADDAEPEEVGELADAARHAERVAKAIEAGELTAETISEMVAEGVAKADDSLAKTTEEDLKRMALTGSGSEQKAALAELGLRVLMGTIGQPDAAGADETPDEPTVDEAAPAAAPDAAATPETNAAEAAPETSASEEEPVAKAQDVVKAMIDEMIGEALAERDERHAAVVKAMQDQIDELAAPAPSKVLTRGVQRDPADRPMPEPHVLRGQNASELRHDTVVKEEWSETRDVGKRKELGDAMEQAASAALAALHARRGPQPR